MWLSSRLEGLWHLQASSVPVTEEEKFTARGRDYLTGLPRTIEISTNQVVTAIDNELKQIVRAVRDVFQETPPELAADIIDQGIIMTGGTSQLQNLPELIFRRTGVRAMLADNPLYCVVNGTGTALDHLDVYKKSIISKR